MPAFVLLTRLIGEEVHPSFALRERETSVVRKIDQHLPQVKWVANYAVMGPWDYLDIFEADGMDTALKVSALVRHYGAAHTEVWPATTWQEFKGSLGDLSGMIGDRPAATP